MQLTGFPTVRRFIDWSKNAVSARFVMIFLIPVLALVPLYILQETIWPLKYLINGDTVSVIELSEEAPFSIVKLLGNNWILLAGLLVLIIKMVTFRSFLLKVFGLAKIKKGKKSGYKANKKGFGKLVYWMFFSPACILIIASLVYVTSDIWLNSRMNACRGYYTKLGVDIDEDITKAVSSKDFIRLKKMTEEIPPEDKLENIDYSLWYVTQTDKLVVSWKRYREIRQKLGSTYDEMKKIWRDSKDVSVGFYEYEDINVFYGKIFLFEKLLVVEAYEAAEKNNMAVFRANVELLMKIADGLRTRNCIWVNGRTLFAANTITSLINQSHRYFPGFVVPDDLVSEIGSWCLSNNYLTYFAAHRNWVIYESQMSLIPAMDYIQWLKFSERIEMYGYLAFSNGRKLRKLAYLEKYEEVYANLDKPLPDFVKMMNSLDQKSWKHVSDCTWNKDGRVLPAQNYQLIALSQALKRYKMDNGKLPDKLSELAPKYLAKELTVSILEGSELVYKDGGKDNRRKEITYSSGSSRRINVYK